MRVVVVKIEEHFPVDKNCYLNGSFYISKCTLYECWSLFLINKRMNRKVIIYKTQMVLNCHVGFIPKWFFETWDILCINNICRISFLIMRFWMMTKKPETNWTSLVKFVILNKHVVFIQIQTNFNPLLSNRLIKKTFFRNNQRLMNKYMDIWYLVKFSFYSICHI